MYDPIFAKSFSRYDRKRFGCFALLFSFLFALSIFSTFNPSLHPLTIIGDAVNLQHAIQDLLIHDHNSFNSNAQVHDHTQAAQNNNTHPNKTQIPAAQNNTTHPNKISNHTQIHLHASNLQLSAQSNLLMLPQAEPLNPQSWNDEPLCRVLKADADYCHIQGDVRVDSNSSTVFVTASTSRSWTIQPYPRKGIPFVKHWTVTVADRHNTIPECTQNHSHPALLFSLGGFTGNHFHDFADILFPLFTTSFPFKTNLHLLASDIKPWWLSKYRPLLHQLSRQPILDIDHQTHHVHCFNKLTAGLRYHRELMTDPTSGVNMSQFRHLLRQTYSLNRKKAVVVRTKKPRLLLVSRKRTRIITNEVEIVRVATKLGYEVVLAESDVSTNLTEVAQLVNSCDVMMGVHGAGLTNMVFLPEKAVLIQIVPLGGIDIFAKLDFGDPSAGMKIRYLEYKIELKESSLLQRYPVDDPVIKDPLSIHRQGWGKLREIYLHNQNVSIDVDRFTPTLAKALKLLQHRQFIPSGI